MKNGLTVMLNDGWMLKLTNSGEPTHTPDDKRVVAAISELSKALTANIKE